MKGLFANAWARFLDPTRLLKQIGLARVKVIYF